MDQTTPDETTPARRPPAMPAEGADAKRTAPDAQGVGGEAGEGSLQSCGDEINPESAEISPESSDWDRASKPSTKPLAPGLHVVATPIGNLGDISPRALGALAGADIVACEDKRVTGRLLSRFAIKASLVAYHDHNADRMRPQLLARLAAGERVVLVSDAGTPLVSDPGFKLVRDAVADGHVAHAVPGPSAVTAALSIAGLPTNTFYFGGFLPPKAAQRRRMLQRIAPLETTLVFFESGKRLAETLATLAETLGPRPAAVAREITKLYEEVRRDRIDLLAAHYREQGAPRGEIVVLVGPPEKPRDKYHEEPGEQSTDDDEAEVLPVGQGNEQAVDDLLRTLSAQVGVKRAATMVSAALGLPKRAIYQRALALSAHKED